MTDIVKRDGKRATEPYSRLKLEHSLQAALHSVKTPAGQAEDTARAVCDHVEQWLATRHEVTAHDLRRKAAEALQPLHPDAAFIYKNYKTIM